MELVHANTDDPSGGRFCGPRNWSGLVTDGFDGMTCPDCSAEIAEIIVAMMGPDAAGPRQNGTDPRRLIYIDGEPWLLDIRFRMLQNNELARAMGFEDEETKYESVGNVTQVTKQIGNAVPVGLAAALVGAALSPSGEIKTKNEPEE